METGQKSHGIQKYSIACIMGYLICGITLTYLKEVYNWFGLP